MARQLEDVIGLSSLGNLSIPADYTQSTEPSSSNPGNIATSIDFNGLGTQYNARDLIGYGFDSTCSTCDNHYSVVFTDGTLGDSSVAREGSHYAFILPLDNTITTGDELCQYILEQLCKPENNSFIDHFQQYTYKDGILYIYDNRNQSVGGFWTSVYKIVIGITATYSGPDVDVGTQYDPVYVTVTASFSNGDAEVLPASDYSLSSLLISQYGPNTFTASYNRSPNIKDNFVVNSTPREIFKITCEYVGPDIHIYDHYNKNDIEVFIYYKDDPLTPHAISISQCVITTTKVMAEGANQFELTFDSSQLPYTTPHMVYKLLYTVNGIGIDYLSAAYTGPDIDILYTHSTDDVRVTIVYKNGDIEPVPNTECIFSSDVIVNQVPYDTFDVYWTDDGGNRWYAFYEVPCIGVIEIKVQYVGPDILIRDDYNYDDLVIAAHLSNGNIIDVGLDECIFEDPTIIDVGPNKKYLLYTDGSGIEWTVFFDIPGIPRPVLLKGSYLGITRIMGDAIPKEQIKAMLAYLINDTGYDENNTEEVELEPKDWFFVYGNIITKENDGWMTIGFEKDYVYTKITLTARVYVPFFNLSNAYLVAWYEGLPVEVGKTYDITKVVIYLCEDGKDRLRLSYTDPGVIIESGVITRVGDNWFTVTYIYGRYTLTTKFPVEGVIYKVYPDVEFQVLYIVKETLEEIDLTEDFRPYFELYDVFYVTWEQFMKRVYDYWKDGTPYFGMFRITVPKNTGLFNKYASSWHVYCKDEQTLKAEIFKLYSDEIKEDLPDGETQT